MRRRSRRVGPPPWSPTPYSTVLNFRPVACENSTSGSAISGSMAHMYQTTSFKASRRESSGPIHQ